MNFKGLIAGMLSLLVTGATFAFVASAATLDSYPTFLASGGQLNAYVVVGSGGTDPAGLASDIAGAVDIAVRLSELQYTKTTVAGSTTTAVTGLDKEMEIAGNDTTTLVDKGFPTTLRDFHFSGLKTGTLSFKGTDYDYHEAVVLTSGVKLDHSYSTSDVNGTEKLTVDSDKAVEYRLYFDKNITGMGTYAAPSYSNTLKVNVMGQEIVITGVGTEGFKALAGTYGLADSTTPLVSGSYSIYVLDGSSGSDLPSSWAKIQVKDANGNILATDSLYGGDSKTYTLGGVTYKVKLTGVFASTITNSVSAQLAFGTDVDKTYSSTASQTSTSTLPGTTNWYVYGSGFGSGYTNTNSYIGVVFWPDTKQYLKVGEVLKAPNDYFQLSFTGWNVDKFATITVSKVTGQSIYDTTSSETAAKSSLNGFLISSDVKGTITYDSTDWWSKMYVLFNGTTAGPTYSVWIGHYYDAGSKIVKDAFTANATANPVNAQLKLSYGSAQSVNYYMVFNITNATDKVYITDSAGGNNVTFDYQIDVGSQAAPTFKMGTNGNSADDADIKAARTGGGVDNIGKATQDVVTNTPVFVLTPSSYTGSDKVVFKIPADTLKAHVAFGTIGATTTTAGGTYYSFAGPIVSPVAKLDSSLTSTEKAAKNLIVVGGPCVNSIAADALGLTYPTCGADSTVPENAAMIKVMDDKFATGLKVVLVAGWTASDTRLASDVLQNYDQATVSSKLVGKSSVTVSGTSVATATIS